MKSVLNRLDPDSYGPASDQLEDEGDLEGADRLRRIGAEYEALLLLYVQFQSDRLHMHSADMPSGLNIDAEESGNGVVLRIYRTLRGNKDNGAFQLLTTIRLRSDLIQSRPEYSRQRLQEVAKWNVLWAERQKKEKR